MSGTRQEEVVLVDDDGRPIGVAEKLVAHRDGGRLHLAFSVFVFNRDGELLLQRRASVKYHFAGLWSNTCCGHPRPGEDVAVAASRRLEEEFGFTTELRPVMTYRYEALDPSSGLAERELLEVFRGDFDGEPHPDPLEIDEWRWTSTAELRRIIAREPETTTPWLRQSFERWPKSGTTPSG